MGYGKLYWALKDFEFVHEGWNIDKFYRVLRGIVADTGYFINETHALVGYTREGQPAAYVFKWVLSTEPDYKYTLKKFFLKLTMKYTMKPIPGSDPKNPQLAAYGTIKIKLDGLVHTDYLGIWEKSAVLGFLRGVRERYFYLSKIERWKQQLRHDADQIFAKSKAYLDYLPTIS